MISGLFEFAVMPRTLGFTGTIMVNGNDIGISISIIGVIASIIALLGATTATIWQKKFTNNKVEKNKIILI